MVSKEPYHAGDICTLSLVDRMSGGPFCRRQTNIYRLHLLFPFPLGCIFFSFFYFFSFWGWGTLKESVQPVSIYWFGLSDFRNSINPFLKGTIKKKCTSKPQRVLFLFFKDRTKNPHLHPSQCQKKDKKGGNYFNTLLFFCAACRAMSQAFG